MTVLHHATDIKRLDEVII